MAAVPVWWSRAPRSGTEGSTHAAVLMQQQGVGCFSTETELVTHWAAYQWERIPVKICLNFFPSWHLGIWKKTKFRCSAPGHRWKYLNTSREGSRCQAFLAQKGLNDQMLGVLPEGGNQFFFLLKFEPFCMVSSRYPKLRGNHPLVVAMNWDIEICRPFIQNCKNPIKMIKENQNNGGQMFRFWELLWVSEPNEKCIIVQCWSYVPSRRKRLFHVGGNMSRYMRMSLCLGVLPQHGC